MASPGVVDWNLIEGWLRNMLILNDFLELHEAGTLLACLFRGTIVLR